MCWLWCLSLLPAQAAEPLPVLRWCLDHFPRFHEFHRPDQPVGPSVDLMQELAKRAGFVLEYSPRTPAARCFRQMETGEADLMSNLNKTPEREASMQLFPYSERVAETLYLRGDDPRNIRQLSQLDRLTLVAVRNYTYHPDLMDLLRQRPAEQRIEVNSIADGFQLLEKGRIDGLLVPTVSSLDYLHSTPRLHQQFKRAPLELKFSTPQYIHIGFSRHSKHPELASRIAEQVAAMMADGTVARLYQQHIGPDTSVLVKP